MVILVPIYRFHELEPHPVGVEPQWRFHRMFLIGTSIYMEMLRCRDFTEMSSDFMWKTPWLCQHSYGKWPFDGWFTIWRGWWFSTVMWNYKKVTMKSLAGRLMQLHTIHSWDWVHTNRPASSSSSSSSSSGSSVVEVEQQPQPAKRVRNEPKPRRLFHLVFSCPKPENRDRMKTPESVGKEAFGKLVESELEELWQERNIKK